MRCSTHHLRPNDRVAGPFDCGGPHRFHQRTDPCTAPYTITDADISAKSIKNIATAAAEDESGNVVTSPSSTVTIRLAALTLDKSTTALSYRNVGNLITYNYTLTNTGGVTLYAPFNVADNHFGAPLGTPFTCGSAASLAPGGVLTCSRTYTIILADINAGSTTNIAVATAQDASSDGNLVTSNNDSVTVYRVIAPVISKSFTPSEIQVGGTSTLRLTISNPNPVTLTGVNVIDNLPANLSLTISPSGNQCGGSVAYDAANNRITLANGSIVANGSCNVTAVVTSTVPGDYLNTTGNVNSSNGGMGNSAQATLSVLAPPLISKSFSPTATLQGESSLMTITIVNPAGNTKALSGVAFQDSLPLNMSVSASEPASTSNCGTPTFSPNPGDTSLNFSGGSIGVGGTCIITVPVTTSISGVFPNTTTAVTSTNGGPGVPSNTATLSVNTAQFVDHQG